MPKICWICGCATDSGEHIPKSSTLASIFKNVSQSQPLYLSNEHAKNKPLQSINSKHVKFKVICSRCNNVLTQPSDRAWDLLLSYLSSTISSKDVGSIIPLNKVYPINRRQQSIYLHHYFLKLFGCVAAHFNIPIELDALSFAILENGKCDLVRIGVGKRDWLNNLTYAGPSNMQTVTDNSGRIMAAVWFLTIDKIVFQLIYCQPHFYVPGLKNTWNPANGKNFRLKSFNE